MNLEADLALLTLSEEIGVPPLNIANVNPNSSDEFTIWGYPRNVATVQGDPVRFSLSMGNNQPTLNNIFRNAVKLKEALGEQGFPSLNAKIIRIGSTIQPGHSGAPIFDRNGNVVAIGDGGLHQGIARINWAIPASVYVAGLPESKDPLPGTSAAANNLFAASSDDAAAPAPATGIKGLTQLRVTTLAKALATLDVNMGELVKTYGDGVLNTRIVVYEDHTTGATFAVPEGMKVELEGDRDSGRFIHASNNDESLFLQIYFGHGNSMKQAMQLLRVYRDAVGQAANWQPVAGQDDDIESDQEDQYYSEYTVRQADDEGEKVLKYSKLAVDQSDFIGVTMLYTEDGSDNPEVDENVVNALALCIELAEIAIK